MAEEIRQTGQPDPQIGPFLARVVSHLDPTYMGGLEVELLRYTGNQSRREGQLAMVRYLSPFSGATSVQFNGEDDTYDATQKSYGFWMVPPDVGAIVMVVFIDGDRKQGYWLGCVQDENMNFMIPGYAATASNVDGRAERVPVAEYNKKLVDGNPEDTTQVAKPAHPFQDILYDQGLLEDSTRGITTSSARREVPSAVFGISTPGPVDKNGPRGKVGKFEHLIEGAYISRLGGSSFVMDDGDDKFLRKQSPSEGPPEYAAVEDGETDGDVTRPHNELIRLRTRTGHQILLHNSEDLIYIGNSRGTAWIELTSDGKIDIFADDSINIRTKQDFNFYADRDMNIEVGRNLNIKVAEEMHTHVLKDQILIVDENQKVQIKKQVDITYEEKYYHRINGVTHIQQDSAVYHYMKQTFDLKVDEETKFTIDKSFQLKTTDNNVFTAGQYTHINSGQNHIETASKIHMNGPTADKAETAELAEEAELPNPLALHVLPDMDTQSAESVTDLETILRRVPTYEPYPHHENLDPTMFKPDITDRDADGRYGPVDTTIEE